jgi:RNA polymerase sigma-70 factor (ECF subfamily)
MAGRREVELAMRGDHDAFASLAEESADRLFALARMILRDSDRAQDATQEALVKAWRDLPRLRDPDRFDAWLRRLLVNSCYDEARRAGRDDAAIRMLQPNEIVGGDPGPPLADRDRVDRGLRRLSVDQRAVLVLHHHLGLTQKEIADTLGIPLGTVKSRLRYAGEAMRAAVEADDRGSRALDDRSTG